MKARKTSNQKNRDMGSEKNISTRFRLMFKLLRGGRTAKLLMFR